MTGTLTSDMEAYNPREEKKEKISKLYLAQGKKLEDTKELVAGDIGIFAKLQPLTPTIRSTRRQHRQVQAPSAPAAGPLARHQRSRRKRTRTSSPQQIHRVSEEDLTFQLHFNPETKQTVVSGMGELQINMILDKIRDSQKIEIETKCP